MLAIVENASGDVEKVAEVERRIIEELRQMGHQVLHRLGAPPAIEKRRGVPGQGRE
jgi:hypothetical protein